jgi:hypothetical protein
MRYIKTYENFYNDDDMAREISMLLDSTTVERFEFDPIYKDTSMFRVYEVDGEVEPDRLEDIKAYMLDEHKLYLHFYKPVYFQRLTVKENRIILTEDPIEDTCIKWLNTNYSGIIAVDSEKYDNYKIYIDTESNAIMAINNKSNNIAIDASKIWQFFEQQFGINEDKIRNLIKEWLITTYKFSENEVGHIIYFNVNSLKRYL